MSQQINLFNPALRKQRDHISAHNLGLAVAGVLALLVALTVFSGWRADQRHAEAQALDKQLKTEQARLAALAQQVAELKPDARIAAELAKAESLLAARKEVIAVLQNGVIGKTEGYSENMRALARQSVTGLWLTGFAISGGGNETEIHGRTLSADLVPAYIRRLNAEKVFNGRGFAALDMKRVVEEAPAKLASEATPNAVLPAAPPPYIEFSLTSAEPAERKP